MSGDEPHLQVLDSKELTTEFEITRQRTDLSRTSDAAANCHKHTKRASRLQHRLSQLREQFATPKAVTNPRESSKYGTHADPDSESYHGTVFNPLEAAGPFGVPVLYGWHLYLLLSPRSSCSTISSLYVLAWAS